MKRFVLILLALVLFAPMSRASIAYQGIVYKNKFAGTNSVDTLTMTNAIVAGQRVHIHVVNEANSKNISSIVDNKSQSATGRGIVHLSSVHNCEYWDYVPTVGLSVGDTITVTWSSAENTDRGYVITTTTGTASSQPDVTVVQTTSPFNTTVTTSITTSTDADYIDGIVVIQGDKNYTLGTGTQDDQYLVGFVPASTVGLQMTTFHYSQSTHGAYSPAGTINVNETALVILYAYKPAVVHTYYVDYAGGTDSLAGTATGTAWKHCPGDTNATSTASTTALVAGDTVIFKGGVTYSGDIAVKASGTISLPITYDLTGATFGSGAANVDLATNYYHFIYSQPAHDYIRLLGNASDVIGARNMRNTAGAVIDQGGTTITNSFRGDGDTFSEGCIFNYGGRGWYISGFNFHDFENAYLRGTLGAESSGDPNQIFSCPLLKAAIEFYSGANDATVTNCQFWAIGEACIKNFGGTNHLYVANNFGGSDSLTNKGWFAVAIKQSDLSGIGAGWITIRQNTFHEGWQYQGDESQQRSHTGDWLHFFGGMANSGSFSTLSSANCVHDVTVDQNWFYNDKAFQYFNGTAYGLFESGWYNFTFKRNLVVNDFSGAFEFRDGDNIGFLGNSFLSTTNTTCLNPKAGATVYNPTNIFLTNNIFATLSPNSANVPCGTSSGYTNTFLPKADYNIYYSPNNGNKAWSWNGTNYTLAAWQTLTGREANSQYGSPGLVNWAAAALSSSGDYHPSTSSIAKNTGTDASAYYTMDYDGNIIGTFPIGALLSNGLGGGGGGGSAASTSIMGSITLNGVSIR